MNKEHSLYILVYIKSEDQFIITHWTLDVTFNTTNFLLMNGANKSYKIKNNTKYAHM